MEHDEKVALVQQLIDSAPARRGDGVLTPWRNDALTTLRLLLGDTNEIYRRFALLKFTYRPKDGCPSHFRDQQVFDGGIHGATELLQAAIRELNLRQKLGDDDPKPQHPEQANEAVTSEYADAMPAPLPDRKRVFVIHGRNDAARREMFTFLRAIGLQPIEWSEALDATGSASPYIGDVLDTAFGMAQAVVVLMTPDEVAYLLPAYRNGDDDPEGEAKPQARPNVLFEAGMAMGRDPHRTVLVELGSVRPFSDVAGRHAVRLAATPEKRKDLAQRLKTAGCDINLNGNDWMQSGDFRAPEVPGYGRPLGRRVPSQPGFGGAHVDGRYYKRSGASDQILLINRSGETLINLRPDNLSEFPGRIWGFPVERLPAYKDVKLKALTTNHKERFDLVVTGETEAGESFRDSVFLDFNG